MAKSRPQRRQVFWRRGGSTTSEPVRGPPTGRRARTVTQLTGLARTVGARGGHEGPGGHPGPHLCCPVLAYCKPCDEASPPPGAWTLSPLWTHASTSGLGKPRRGFPQASTAFIVFENLLMNITTGLLHPTTGSRIRSYYRPPTPVQLRDLPRQGDHRYTLVETMKPLCRGKQNQSKRSRTTARR